MLLLIYVQATIPALWTKSNFVTLTWVGSHGGVEHPVRGIGDLISGIVPCSGKLLEAPCRYSDAAKHQQQRGSGVGQHCFVALRDGVKGGFQQCCALGLVRVENCIDLAHQQAWIGQTLVAESELMVNYSISVRG